MSLHSDLSNGSDSSDLSSGSDSSVLSSDFSHEESIVNFCRYSANNRKHIIYMWTGYEDEQDFYMEIVKKFFLEQRCFPRDLCKNCYFKYYELLFVHLYGQRFRDHFHLLRTWFVKTISTFRCLHIQLHFSIGERKELVYPIDTPKKMKYFDMFSSFTKLVVDDFVIGKPPCYNFVVESFYAEIIPYWSHCINSVNHFHLRRHSHLPIYKQRKIFTDIPSFAIRSITKNKKVHFQKDKSFKLIECN